MGQGVEIVEMYGTSETGICVMTPPGQRREGWSGKVSADCEIKIADDGEILVKSPVMMEGYLGDDQLTRDAMDPNGYYLTGDFGELADGWVKILGRKKDVFNTPTGNNIFPARIEGLLEQLPSIHQAVLVGDARPYLTALLVCSEHVTVDTAALVDQIREINRKLEDEERVRRIFVLDAPLTADLYRPVGHGKVRRERKLIDERLKDVLDGMYAAEPAAGVFTVPVG